MATGSHTLMLRDWNSAELTPPASGDSVFLIALRIAPAAAGGHTVDVSGMSFNASRVEVRIDTAGAGMTATVAVAGNRFAATLVLPAGTTLATGTITARNNDTGSSGRDRAAFVLPEGADSEFPEPRSNLLEPARLAYAAGSPDRLQFARMFVKLDPAPVWIAALDRVYVGDGKIYRGFDAPRAQKAVDKEVRTLRAAVDAGRLPLADYGDALAQRIRAVLPQFARAAPDGFGERLRKHRQSLRDWHAAVVDTEVAAPPAKGRRKSATASAQARTAPVQSMYAPPVLDEVVVDHGPRPGDALEELIDRQLEYWRAHARLGVLFHERLRIRPTRMVFGEPIYQLALTPGEEVQIRQTSETRRKTALTEIRDRQDENEASFSSTWSTDMASSISSQTSFQQSTNVGAGVSGQLPEVPVTISADVATTTSNAESSSGQTSVNQRRERTAATSAKMRQQHRVQIELAAEDNLSLGSTRTLRNLNPLRSVMHTFHKVYRKEQISLERFGAQLCIRLTVDDPARLTRSAFLTGLAKLDPELQAERNVLPPLPLVVETVEKTLPAPSSDGGGIFHGLRFDRFVTWAHDLRAEAGVGSEYVLASAPTYAMTRCGISFHGDGRLHGDNVADPDAVPDSQRSEEPAHVLVGWSFVRHGGTVRWINEPGVGVGDTQASLKVNLPMNYSAVSVFGELENQIYYVKFVVETRWRPSDVTMQEYLAAVQAERLRLNAMFEVDRVYALHAIAEQDYPSGVLDRALAEGLTYPPDFEFRLVKEIFDLEGVVMDNVPYWVGGHSRGEFDNLSLRLQRLPAQLELTRLLTDALTASQAVVYLPIRHGQEAAALRLLPEAAATARDIAADFSAFRTTRYGPLPHGPLPTLAVHMGPVPVPATGQGASDWENDWERPQDRFDLLGQWSELVPTDGVHVESHLANAPVADEYERLRLGRGVAG